jgi:hypothetical protein
LYIQRHLHPSTGSKKTLIEEKERKKTMREQEKARTATTEQEYSRTFHAILQLSISLPFSLYIYERVHVSNSDI